MLAMEEPFKSERLVYRAVEDNPQDDDFLTLIQTNAKAYANSSTSLHVPQSKKATVAGYRAFLMDEALLGAIVCLDDDKKTPIGIVSLMNSGLRHKHHRSSDIGIDIAEPYQGKGYGSEAIYWVPKWGFQTAGLHRIGIEAFSYNKGAIRLYEKLGFVPEGVKREALWHNGGWHDFVSYSLLEHEWRAKFLKAE